jgi:hypothetical protein
MVNIYEKHGQPSSKQVITHRRTICEIVKHIEHIVNTLVTQRQAVVNIVNHICKHGQHNCKHRQTHLIQHRQNKL